MAQAPHRFTVEAYEEMARVGLLPENGVELVDGVVVEMSPHGPRHALALVELNPSFVEQCRGRYRVWPNCLSLPLGPRDMPDPDLVLSRVECDFRRRLSPAQVFLLVEISDSSLKYDLGSKRARYARAGIAEYWVVDLVHDELRAFTNPDRERGEYRDERRYRPGEEAAPSAFPDVRIDVARVLGAASS
ncbi:MAG: Uma2 family endonuclease [Candidatus Baltobacteraceae bacterium]